MFQISRESKIRIKAWQLTTPKNIYSIFGQSAPQWGNCELHGLPIVRLLLAEKRRLGFKKRGHNP